MSDTAVLLRGGVPRSWPKTGWYWCLHHDQLVEWCTDIHERVRYIHKMKPPDERLRRCTMLRPVLGPLPDRVAKVRDEYVKAWANYDKAWDDYARPEYGKARAAYDKAGAKWVEALAKYAKEFIAQHNTEYPATPWIGPTIFEGGPR